MSHKHNTFTKKNNNSQNKTMESEKTQNISQTQFSLLSTNQISNEYITLVLEMQKLLSLKFDALEHTISKLSNENSFLKGTLIQMEKKLNIISKKNDNLFSLVSENNNTQENLKNTTNTTNCCDLENNVDSKKLSVKNTIPIEMVLNHILGNNEKQKEISNDVENDDDNYDLNEKIYCDEKIVEIENLHEFKKIPKNIDDLLELGETYQDLIHKSQKKKSKTKHKLTIGKIEQHDLYEFDGKKYALNLETIVNLKNPLKKLNNMIGMKKVKDSVFEMILYYLQGFETKNQNMLHSVIEGPPGTGKTQLGKILGEIYCAMGIIESNNFKYVKATDLIGDHVGATKHMTQSVIDDADGGILFIDEAYALSSNDNKDPYGKECIDTINFNLSEKKKKLIVIIAGYPDQLEKFFFSLNPGLQRRFPFRHRVDKYSPEELRDIFIDKLKRFKWKLDSSLNMEDLTEFFKNNKDNFPNFGGDIENLFKKCQYAHSNRVVGKNPTIRKRFTLEDLQNGLIRFKESKSIKEDFVTKYPGIYI